MKCTITGKGMKLTEGMKDAVVTSLSRLDKFFDEEPVAKVVCKKDANIHKIEVMITYHKKNIRYFCSDNYRVLQDLLLSE